MSVFLSDLRSIFLPPVPELSNVFSSNTTAFDHVLETLGLSSKENIPRETDLSRPELNRVCNHDYHSLLQYKESVISGYLNLSEEDGWHEGFDPRLGVSFTRYILLQYVFKNKNRLGGNESVFEKTVQAFKACESFYRPNFFEKVEVSYHPKRSRVCHDSTVQGWQKHSICRLVGNLGSVYDPSKPFFEILVNSARYEAEDPICRPFFVSIHANESEMEKRRQLLASQSLVPSERAHFTFYSSTLKKPQEFLREHKEKLGPNSTRLLNGLIYLQNVELPAQVVGNCWMKQPLRSLLATLYVELLSHRPTLTFAHAWNEAKELYKDVQRTVAIPFVEQLIAKSAVSDERKNTARFGLARQKRL